MGVYVSVRGWLQCDTKQLAAIQEIISSRADGANCQLGYEVGQLQ